MLRLLLTTNHTVYRVKIHITWQMTYGWHKHKYLIDNFKSRFVMVKKYSFIIFKQLKTCKTKLDNFENTLSLAPHRIWGFSAHDFNTRSGGALRLPFLDSERRSESIFGIQSAPPLSSYIWCWKRAPLSTHIWHSERPSPRFQAIYGVESVPRFQPIFSIQSAFKLYFVLKAGPYLVFRASEQRGALNAKYGLKAGHAFNIIYRFKAEGRSECQIWTRSTALSLKMGVEAGVAPSLKIMGSRITCHQEKALLWVLYSSFLTLSNIVHMSAALQHT